MNLEALNEEFQNVQAEHRILLARRYFPSVVATSSFGTYSALALDLIARTASTIPIIFLDTKNLTPETYSHRDRLINMLGIIVHTYTLQEGETKTTLLQRAFRDFQPKAWISGIMSEETTERQHFTYLMQRSDGIIKIHPLLDWNSRDAFQYLRQRELPINDHYIDPEKPEKGECGIHLDKLIPEQLASLNSSKL